MFHLDKEKFRVGMRTTKSGVAVGFCVLLFKLLDRGSPMLAGLAAVFALREDCSQSLHHGLRRVGGNTVAGILGVTLIAIKDFLGLDFSVDFFGTIIAVIILMRGLQCPGHVDGYRRRNRDLPCRFLQY